MILWRNLDLSLMGLLLQRLASWSRPAAEGGAARPATGRPEEPTIVVLHPHR